MQLVVLHRVFELSRYGIAYLPFSDKELNHPVGSLDIGGG